MRNMYACLCGCSQCTSSLFYHVSSHDTWLTTQANHVQMLIIHSIGNEMMVFYASVVHIVQAKLGQADAGDNEAKLMTCP